MGGRKQNRIFRGVTIVEVLAVVAIVAIMSMVMLGRGAAENRNRIQLKAEAELIVARAKQMQNYALTGKVFQTGKFPCYYTVSQLSAIQYKLSYRYRDNITDNCGTAGVNADVAQFDLQNGIRFSGSWGNFGYHSPFGGTYLFGITAVSSSPFPEEIKISKGSLSYLICVCSSGKVFAEEGAACDQTKCKI